jgi:hypothetical protein
MGEDRALPAPPMSTPTNRPRVDRFTVEPMYSSVSVVHKGREAGDGHIYEVSLGGVRLELDEALPKRAPIELEITLPGCSEAIAANGRVVEVFDVVDDPGPRRMVVAFESFKEGAEDTLKRYLSQKWLKRADDQRPDSPSARASDSASTSPAKVKSASAA